MIQKKSRPSKYDLCLRNSHKGPPESQSSTCELKTLVWRIKLGNRPEQVTEVFQSLRQSMPTADTAVKPCTVAIDCQRFSGYAACTFEWQIGVYPRVTQYSLFTTIINR